MQIKLYSTAKKSNSTRRPTASGLVATVDANIKDNCSVLNPVLLLTYDQNYFNYVQIPAFGGRYYFVDDIILNHGLTEVHCSVDVLASYKVEIGSTDMLITRSSYSYDGNIIDSNYPGKSNVQTSDVNATISELNFTGFSNGYYVLGVQGYGSASTNMVIYYELSPANFLDVIKNFYNSSGDNSRWGNLAAGVKNSLNKLDDFIVSCRWFPFSFLDPNETTQYSKVYLGNFNSGVDGAILTGPRTALSTTVSLPVHPQASARGNWLKKSPYTRYEVIDPLIGKFGLNPEDIYNDGLTISIRPDYTTGVCQYSIISGSKPIYYTYEKLGIDISLNGSQVDVTGVAMNLAGAVVKATAEKWVGSLSSIGNALQSSMVQNPGNKGPSGGYVNFLGNRYVRTYFMLVTDEDNANYGRPYCKVAKPQNVPGFLKAENPHVVTLGTDTETNMINSMIEAGIYYE